MKSIVFLVSLLALTLSGNQSQSSKQSSKFQARPRIACHLETDFINRTTVKVCGDWTEYPPTKKPNYANEELKTWLEGQSYDIDLNEGNPKTGKIFSDESTPSNTSSAIRGLFTVEGDAAYYDVQSITVTSSFTSRSIHYQSTSTSYGGEAKVILGGKLSKFHLEFSFGGQVQKIESTQVEDENQITHSYNFDNPYLSDGTSRLPMRVLKLQYYYPIRIRRFSTYSPGSYISSVDYLLIPCVNTYYLRSWSNNTVTSIVDGSRIPLSSMNDIDQFSYINLA